MEEEPCKGRETTFERCIQEIVSERKEDQRIFEIQNVSGIKSARKRVLIPGVKHDEGETIASRKVIAHVFGEFYSKLYDSNETEGKLQNTLSHNTRTVDDEKKQW